MSRVASGLIAQPGQSAGLITKLLRKKFHQEVGKPDAVSSNLTGPTLAKTRENSKSENRKASKKKSRILEKSELEELKTDLQRILPTLAKHNVEDLRALIHQSYVKRFKRSRIPKHGNLNKGFTEYE